MKQKKAGVSAFTPAFRLVARHILSSRCLQPAANCASAHRGRIGAAQEPHRSHIVWRAHHLFKAYGLTLRQSPDSAPKHNGYSVPKPAMPAASHNPPHAKDT